MAAACYSLPSNGSQAYATAVDFHPTEYILCHGDINGNIRVDTVTTPGSNPPLQTTERRQSALRMFENPCRAIAFNGDGDLAVCGSQSGGVSTLDVETMSGIPCFREDKSDGAGLHCVSCLENNSFVTGDEHGDIQLWDLRSKVAILRDRGLQSSQGDFITALAYHAPRHSLFVTSGDGTLAVYDLRKLSICGQSDVEADDEYLSLAILSSKRKVLVGTQSGVVNLFSWGHWEDCSDRMLGHPEAIDALLAFDEETVLTGASDGGIRVVSVLPNKLLGVIGVHGDAEPIEALAMSHDRRMLASIAHDQCVRLWSLDVLHDGGSSSSDGTGSSKTFDEAGSASTRVPVNGPTSEGVGQEAPPEEAAGPGSHGGVFRPAKRKKGSRQGPDSVCKRIGESPFFAGIL